MTVGYLPAPSGTQAPFTSSWRAKPSRRIRRSPSAPYNTVSVPAPDRDTRSTTSRTRPNN